MENYRVCSQKFALFLYKNNHLEDFTINKDRAKILFESSFKQEYKTKLKFGGVFYHTLCLLNKPQKDLNVVSFKKNKLLNLLSTVDSGTPTKEGRAVKKNTLISHSFSFNNGNRNGASMISQSECKICDTPFTNESSYKQHLNKAEHIFFEKLHGVLTRPGSKQPELEFSIEGCVSVSNIILRPGEARMVHLKVKNVCNEIIKIVTIQVKPNAPEIKFTPSYPFELGPSTSVESVLTIDCPEDSSIYYPILFIAEKTGTIENYATELIFHAHSEFFDDLHPVEQYKRYSKPVFKEYVEEIVSAERPNGLPKMAVKLPLKQYFLPVDIAVCLNAGLKEFNGITESHRSQLISIQKLLNVENKAKCLTAINYTSLLDLLLYIEEHQLNKDIRDYDREGQILKTGTGNLLELEIPGLAEHRPSVIFGDSVIVREQKSSKTLYEGVVHNVKENSVLLKFSKRFMDTIFLKGKKFYINFTVNRYPLKVEHQAVEFTKIDNLCHLFFPKKVSHAPLSNQEVKWFNSNITNNPEQQQAVRCIIQKTAMPAPYLIFGPPGTGKTMTVVESVKQIHKLTQENVLICAPSNNAANEVTRRLIDTIPSTDLFRYMAPSFPYHQIPSAIKKYINYDGGSYYQPTIDKLIKYRIVITTLVSAARLVNSGCPKNHFSYVFIDESGQATETETLIPIARILSGGAKSGVLSGQIVLAGDPKQLGPIIHSPLAKEYGFGTSMLERLMDFCEIYKKDQSHKYNPHALTKLLKNYRSHPVIMQPSNNLFYENELITAGDNLIYAGIGCEILPNPKFPMLFHSVVGLDQREKSSPSFFNIQEIQAVVSYLDRLIGCNMQGMKIREEHIAVISPYKKQIEKIKQCCKKKKYESLLIGTVEQIQGQERLIVIISTVRSKFDLLKFDHKFHLGFLDNPKRFNVAITRAKALLIILGNPNILQYDKYWHNLIAYCKNNHAVVGERFDFGEEVLQKNMEQLSLNADEADLEGGI